MASRPAGWTPTPLVGASIALHALAAAGAVTSPAAWPWLLGGVGANHLLLGLAGMRPRSRLLGPNLSRLPPSSARRGEVALTFDDGPDPEVTPAVLDLLDRRGARASFFCIGVRAEAHPELVRDILRRGHSVENHTHTHPAGFAFRGPAAMRREVLRAQRALASISAGDAPRFVRAPLGLRSPLFDPAVADLGLTYTSWTRRGLDGISRDPARVLGRLTCGLAPGDILLLHDGSCARTPGGTPVVLAVLPPLLERLGAGGFTAVSLPQAAADQPALARAACARR